MAWAERALKHSHCPKSLLSTPKRKWKRTSYNNRTKPPSTTFAFPHLSAVHRACQVQSCQGKHWVGGGPTKNLSHASDKHCLTLLSTPKPLVVLPGPALPGNKGNHWVGGGQKAHLPPLPAYQATGSTSSTSMQTNPKKFSHPASNRGAFQFSNLNQRYCSRV